MKFSLFAHMERYDQAKSYTELFNELEELIELAEVGGFETAWIGEHHGMDFTIAPNPFIQIAHVGANTSRIRLGTGNLIAPFWHPLRLAGEAAMTDLAVNGRLDLGIARGAYSFEYERLSPGLDAWQAGQRMRELIPAVKRLWDGDYEHHGEYWYFPKSTSCPKPLQERVPIWVAARDPNSHEFAVSQGCNVQVTPLASGDEEVTNLMSRFEAACSKYPDIPRPRIMLLQHTFVTESSEETTSIAGVMSGFYNLFGAWFQNKQPVNNGLMLPPSEAEMKSPPQYSPELIAKNLVIGEPEAVIARLKRYESLGFDQFAVWMDSGLSHPQKKRSLQLFIEEVMPAFA